ncbi:serine--tRNA ligase [Mollicutes bacterium LVI A0039]|nr:serine--tRNA ligase [Mollicutes bacterium LVI A0039]
MLDIKRLINEKEQMIASLNLRGSDFTQEIEEIIATYEEYTKKLNAMEVAKSELNKKSKLIGQYKKAGKDTTELFAEIESLKQDTDKTVVDELRNSYTSRLMKIPNFLQADTPIGNDDEDNVEVKVYGEKPHFDFEPKQHFEVTSMQLDFDRAAKISKSRFVITKGLVARLERAITNYMLDTHSDRGYMEIGVPFIANQDSLYASGQLPKFENDLFKIAQNGGEDDEFENERSFYLIPTAEVVLANMHRDEIIEEGELPLNYTAYSQCFRKEAGSAGRDTRGLIRMHQFGKVELFKYTDEATSNAELEKMVEDAEKILQDLGLHYRIVRLCSGDVGFGASKTFDLEVWFPSQDKFREVSSCSNVWDFQARRGKIRYRDAEGNVKHPHMLNGSGMATGRILAAILENFQNEDGTVEIPKVLLPYLNR